MTTEYDPDRITKRICANKEFENCGLSEERVRETLRSFEGNELASIVFLRKYAKRSGDNKVQEWTLEEAKDRWATEIAGIEEKEKSWKNKKPVEYFKELYNYFLPAGRQMSALGNLESTKASLSNCYTTNIEEDSLEGIFQVAYEIAKTFSYSGGQGLCLGSLRPRKSIVSNTARFSTGAVSFAGIYDNITGTIGQHGRRGALAITIPVNHPDVFEFIELKHHDTNKIKYANLSVKISDKFMNAVEMDNDFTLHFATKHEEIRKKVSARELWWKIVQAARDSSEPGLLFWDTVTRLSPASIYNQLKIVGINPCGEQSLSRSGACVLGSILLHEMVVNPFLPQATFDWDRLREAIEGGVRHLDNTVQLNLGRHPLPEQNEKARLGRNIGLGVTGLADTLVALGIQYGSEKALEFTDKLFTFKMENEYLASQRLARDRGSFPLFDPERHYETGFCSALPKYIKDHGRKYGQRNVTISTIAPNGSIAIVAQCSNGIENVFARKSLRAVELGKERETYTIIHPGILRYKKATGKDDIEEKFPSAYEIDWRYKIDLQAIAQKYIDSAISNTVNLPKDVDADTVSEIYAYAWKKGLKGITVYRDTSRANIISSAEEKDTSEKIDTRVHKFIAEGGDKFYIHVSYRNRDIKKPYQIFTVNYKATENDRFVKLSNDLRKYIESLGEVSERKLLQQLDRSQNSLIRTTRLISLGLKHGKIDGILDVVENHAFIGTLAGKLKIILEKSRNAARECSCTKCESKNIRVQEGCSICLDCGNSLCG
jgi:ribonucleoside-diphosphate reductase alpha chain